MLKLTLATVLFFLLTAVADKYVETQRREYLGVRSEGIDRRAVYFDRLAGTIIVGPSVSAE